jgi:hypothetical protein
MTAREEPQTQSLGLAREELAAVLAEHLLRRVTCGDEWVWECTAPECVWMDSRDTEGLEGHRTHLADALLASPALARVIREAKAEAWDVAAKRIRAALAQPATDEGGDEWCRREDCRHRHWRSGSMPTHRRGTDCPSTDDGAGA